ncbi:MAG: hypothetical protein HPY50_11925 [Firmicutes bacterium]|nr:hypothetical protein [Bacillota bacterium]
MKQIGVKYCGGCNPQIDRSQLVKEIGKRLPDDCRLVTGQPREGLDAVILLCGCPAACVDRAAIGGLTRDWILVSGPMVDLINVPAHQVADVVVSELLKKIR